MIQFRPGGNPFGITDAYLVGDVTSSERMVPSNHDGPNARPFASEDGGTRFRPGRINQTEHAYEGQFLFDIIYVRWRRQFLKAAKGHSDDAHAVSCEPVICCGHTLTPLLIQRLPRSVDPNGC